MNFWSKKLASALLALTFACLPLTNAWAARLADPKAEHVFIVSFDGGKPTVMKESKMPCLNSLLPNSAYTWTAHTTLPSVTLVSHTSMLTGVGPAKHKILWNDWQPEHGLVKVPTIFSLASAEKLSTAMFVGKQKFKHLALAGSLSLFSLPDYHAKIVAQNAADYIVAKKPNLCFIHFADSDGAGHQYGWGSYQQKSAFADEDEALATVLKAIEQAGIKDNSVVILTADHGGHGHTHGSSSPEDVNIPWIATGEGVKKGLQIDQPITTYDTAATALWLLGVPLPKEFDGHPVTAAFN